MVQYTQKNCQLLPMNCSSVFDNFVGLALKRFIQELGFDFVKKPVFTPLTCYGISVVVYWYVLVRLWVELFVSKGLIQAETAVSKKASTWSKNNKNDNKENIELTIFQETIQQAQIKFWPHFNDFLWC